MENSRKGRPRGAPGWWRMLWTGLISFLFMVPFSPLHAAGDLLVAPTRVIFERAARTADVTLTNIGEVAATYRISLEIKRMTADGQLVDIAEPNEIDKLTQNMIRFAPRKILLTPSQPQQIRLSLRKPENLADGEYRVHMLFRAIPEEGIEQLAAQNAPTQAISIQLRPIYGITIPIFVRQGNIDSRPAIKSVEQKLVDGRPMLAVTLTRDGQKSIYGALKITQAGAKQPVGYIRGVAVYPEVTSRTVLVPIDPKIKGKVAVQYITGGELDAERVAAEANTVLN